MDRVVFVGSVVVKSADSRTRLHEFRSWLFYLLALLDLCVPVSCKLGKIIVPAR